MNVIAQHKIINNPAFVNSGVMGIGVTDGSGEDVGLTVLFGCSVGLVVGVAVGSESKGSAVGVTVGETDGSGVGNTGSSPLLKVQPGPTVNC